MERPNAADDHATISVAAAPMARQRTTRETRPVGTEVSLGLAAPLAVRLKSSSTSVCCAYHADGMVHVASRTARHSLPGSLPSERMGRNGARTAFQLSFRCRVRVARHPHKAKSTSAPPAAGRMLPSPLRGSAPALRICPPGCARGYRQRSLRGRERAGAGRSRWLCVVVGRCACGSGQGWPMVMRLVATCIGCDLAA